MVLYILIMSSALTEGPDFSLSKHNQPRLNWAEIRSLHKSAANGDSQARNDLILRISQKIDTDIEVSGEIISEDARQEMLVDAIEYVDTWLSTDSPEDAHELRRRCSPKIYSVFKYSAIKSHRDAGQLPVPSALEPNPVTSVDPLDAVEQIDDYRVVYAALDELPDRKRQIVTSRFGLDGGEPQTYDKIAAQHGLTRERIRQIAAHTLHTLKIQLEKPLDRKEPKQKRPEPTSKLPEPEPVK